MKRLTLSVLSVTLCTTLTAQKTQPYAPALEHLQGTESSMYVKQSVSEENEASFLSSELNLSANFSLELETSIESITAIHNHYSLSYKGKPVFNGNIHTVRLKSSGELQKIMHNNIPLVEAEGQISFPASKANHFLDQYQAEQILHDDLVWVAKDGQLIAARSTEIMSENLLQKELIYTKEGLIFNFDHLKHHHADGPNDTTISVYVFEPDPLTTAGVNYSGSYVDNNDAATTVLENQKKLRTTTAFYNSSTGIISLENDFVHIQELSLPSISPVTSTNDQFLYDRSQSGFEDVNVLYHLTNHKLHMDGLGFSSLPGYQMDVDVHALGGDDNSVFFTGSSPNRLLFGEGGVDDAEDADVIIHEYTHAYALAASNNNTGTVERECLEESLGDYFAASYSRSISSFNKEQVFSWDGHNEFWDGREVESTKDYKQVNFVFDIYEHTDLWASPLMEAYGIIGRNTMDQIVMEAIYSLGSNTTFRDMAIHVLDADYALNNGANFGVLKTAFVRRNILEANYVSLVESNIESQNYAQLFGSYEFAQGGELFIESEEAIDKLVVYSVSGQIVKELSATGNKKSIELSSYDFKPGVYLLNVYLNKGTTQSFKVARF